MASKMKHRSVQLHELEIGEFTFRYHATNQSVGSLIAKVVKKYPDRSFVQSRATIVYSDGSSEVAFRIKRVA